MLKVAVLSDLHLGFAYGTERGEDSFANAEQAFSKALSEDPDLILIPGDIFHDKIPRPEVLGRAIDLFAKVNNSMKSKPLLIKRIKENKLSQTEHLIPPIIAIWGTHERRHSGSVNPAQILEKAGLIYCLHAESILVEVKYSKLGIHGLSGVPESYARDALKSWSPRPFEEAPNVLMLHQNFKELLPVDDALSFMDLPDGFDLFLLGHIHWPSESSHPKSKAPIIFPGSTVITQLNKIESEKEKGIYIIEFDRRKIRWRFKSISARPFFYEKINVTGLRPNEIAVAILQKINEYLRKEYDKKPLLRIRLEGTFAEGFSTADLNITSIIKDHADKLILSIDKSRLVSTLFEQQTELLSDLKEKKISIDQLGMHILKTNLKEGISAAKLETLFNLLANSDLEKVEEIL